MKNNEKIHYLEYQNDLQIDSVIFDDKIYWDVLTFANDKVVSYNKLYKYISEKYKNISEDKVTEIISDLKDKYLLYASHDFKKIVSIINTDNLK